MSTSSASAIGSVPRSKLLESLSEFVIRRRILLSSLLFIALIGQDVAFGPKPHNPLDLTDPISAIGVSLVVVGVALRSWAVGILRKDRELTTTGPYRMIRNPLYVGSFLMMFGFCTLIADPINFLFILGPILVIYIVKVRGEEKLLARLFPQQWSEFSRSTPRFFPRPRRVALSADWRLAQWVRCREYQALAASLAALAGIAYWHWM